MTTNGDTKDRGPRNALRVALAVSLAAVFTSACGSQPAQSTPGAAEAALPEGTVVVSDANRVEVGISVEPAKTITRTDQLQAPAVLALDENRTARIGSMVEGLVMEASAEIGDRVPAGKVLAAMHSGIIHEAWAGYRTAIAERRRLTTELTYAVQADERARRLFTAKAISEQEVQRAYADRVAAEEALNIAATEVRRAEEELQHLGITSGDDPTGESGEEIPVRAPIAGVVIEKLVTQGTAVTPGTPLFVVSNLSSLWALAEIDETALPHVEKGRPVQVTVSAYPDQPFPGTITFVGDLINPKTRRVTVRCQVPNPDGRLKPEMYATVALGEGDPRTIVAVPSQAVQDMGGQMVVFIDEGSGRFRRRDVTVGADVDGWIEITAGLQAGERIAATGAFLLKSELLKQTMAEG